ncbi:putative Bloom syndrome protein like protein, partial [Fusarium oxysporum f. sp. albedinis]
MGESSGLARFAECGIASTRAFTMRLTVIGQRLDCKRRFCQLNAGLDFPCLVPARSPPSC